MHRSYHQLTRVPVGTKYVLEACGPFVRRYVEFPDGRKLALRKRKSTCGSMRHRARSASRR